MITDKVLFTLVLTLSLNSYLHADSNKEIYDKDAVTILEIGREYNYIEDLTPLIKDASQFEIETSKKFGTYEDLKNGNVISTGKVWLGTIVKKTKENKCFALSKYVSENYTRIGTPEIKQSINEIQCEEFSLGNVQHSSKIPNHKKIGLFAGDEEIIETEIISEKYNSDGSLTKIVVFDYKNKQSRQCVLLMSNKEVVSSKNFNPEKRICYPYYGF